MPPIYIPPGAIDGVHPEHPIVIPPPTAPGGGGEHPAHPIVIPPDAAGPGKPEHPIVIPPTPPGQPSHPIVLPPNEPPKPLENWDVVAYWRPDSGWGTAIVPSPSHPGVPTPSK
jgi:hypothetical protein